MTMLKVAPKTTQPLLDTAAVRKKAAAKANSDESSSDTETDEE